jgi:hypothetical protein
MYGVADFTECNMYMQSEYGLKIEHEIEKKSSDSVFHLFNVLFIQKHF